MSARLIKQHFERELAKVGYPKMEVYFSLGYTQDDGMAFTGQLHCSDLLPLANRLLQPPLRAAFRRALEKEQDLSIKITTRGRYSHWNSMDVEWEDYSHPDNGEFTLLEKQAVGELLIAVREDVKEVSKRLEKEGYKIHEAGSPGWIFSGENEVSLYGAEGSVMRTYRTKRFEVKVVFVEDSDFDMGHWDEEEIENTLAEIVAGKQVYGMVAVQIHDRVTGAEWASNVLGGVVDNRDMKYMKVTVPREIIGEAVDEAREKLEEMRVPTGEADGAELARPLISAIRRVVDNWASGDLAGAVNHARVAADAVESIIGKAE